MAVEYQNKSEAFVTGTEPNFTMNAPDGFSAGDLFIAIVTKDDDPAIVLPTGGTWTLIQSGTGSDPQMHFSVSYRIAVEGDTSWTWTGDDEQWYGVILRYTGQAVSDFIHASGKNDGDSTAPTAPSVGYTDLEVGSLALHCFGQDYDRIPYTSPYDLIERYSGEAGGCGGAGGDKGTIIDSYSEDNFQYGVGLSNTILKISQSFTATAGKLSSCIFYLEKINSPTGNIVAKLYSHSGTYGSSSVPDTLLATSDARSLADMPETRALVDFVFTGINKYSLVNGTKYCIAIESADCDATNMIGIGYDASTPTHSGNYAQYITSWIANSGRDIIFYVLSAGGISGSGSTGTAIFTTDAADEWLAVTVVIEAESSGVTHEIAGISNGTASFTTLGSIDWQVISAINAFNQTDGALTKLQTYNFDFSYDDGNWDLGIFNKAFIQNGVLDIVSINGYGIRYPDANWYSGANDNFEIEIDFKQDDLFNGAQTYIKLVDDGTELSFSVEGLDDEMTIYYGVVKKASQAFVDDTSWHTMKIRRIGTTFYFSIDGGSEISWDYEIARALDWVEFKMLGVTGDFDNFKYKLEEPFYLRSGISTISSTTGNLEIWQLIAGAINAINQTDGNLIANRNLIGEIDAVNQLITSLTKLQNYNFDFSYDDKEWVLNNATISGGVLDITNFGGYGRRNPDDNWLSGANDDFVIEVDWKMDSDVGYGAYIMIMLNNDVFLRFDVLGSTNDLYRIYCLGAVRVSDSFNPLPDTWYTARIRRVGTTFYYRATEGLSEISWDYGTASALEYVLLAMDGCTGDFDNLKWKWEEPFYLRSGINTISSTITNLEIWKLIAGATNGLSSLTSSIQADWEISGILNSIALLTNIAKVERTINGTSDAISNFISLMSADWKIDSTIDGISSNIAFLKRIFSVNSIINSISSTTGNLEIWKLIIGIINALSSTTGNIFLDRNIISSVNALSETISSIIANYALSVETNGISQTISNILLDRSITGASNALSQTISNIIANWQITSTINGISQIDTIAKLDMAIISTINGLASTTGDLTQFGTILIEGIANGLSQLISKINADWSINGTLQGQSNYISLLNADWQIDSNIDGISITDGFLKRNFIVDGIINGLSTTTGHTIISRLINSIITGQTTFDGILKADWSLFGDINSLSQTDGIIYLDKSIIGTINGVSELVSAIIADWSINGISSANAQTTANLIALYELLGTIDGIASTTGILTLTGEILLAGIIDILALLSGLGKVDWNISGNTNAISQMDANIIANWTLLGNINPLSQTLGDLTLLTEILLAGIISALTQLYGKTNVNRLIGGTFQGQSSNIALLSTIYQILGTTQGQSILDALLGKLFSINGTSQGITTINGLTKIDYSIDSLINGQGQTIGNILRDISLYGTSNAYALLSGNVLLEKLIASIINGVASLDGTLQQVIIARLITEILKGNSIITKEIFLNSDITKNILLNSDIINQIILNSDITKQKDLNSLVTTLKEEFSKINKN